MIVKWLRPSCAGKGILAEYQLCSRSGSARHTGEYEEMSRSDYDTRCLSRGSSSLQVDRIDENSAE